MKIQSVLLASLLSLFTVSGWSQQSQTQPLPACIVPFTQTAAGMFTIYDNRPKVNGPTFSGACTTWTITYFSSGFSAESLTVYAGPDDGNGNGINMQAWASAGGTVVTGSLPLTSTSQGYAGLSGYFPHVGLNVTSVTGTGTITGWLYGYRSDQGLAGGTLSWNNSNQVTANAGTNLNTSLLALEAGGNLSAIKTDVDKIPASPATETGHLAAIDTSTSGSKTDLDSIVTNTANRNPAQASFTDRSIALTTGGTSQTLIASNGSRKRIVIQNPCTAASEGIGASENIFINFTSAASATAGSSIELQPCGSYDSGPGPVTTEAITVVAATTAHKIIAKEQ